MDLQQKHLQSKQLANDYISWRLAKSGYHQWNIINKIDISKNGKKKLFLMMRQMGYEFESKYNSQYMPLIDELELNQSNCKDIFLSIIYELFQISPQTNNTNELNESKNNNQVFECNWGRIIGLFAFSGCLAIKCYDQEMPNLIYEVINWLSYFLNDDSRISNWIESKGNWNGFVDHFDNVNNGSISSSNFDNKLVKKYDSNYNTAANRSFQLSIRNLFCKISQVIGLTFTSLGVITLGAIYIKKR